MAIAGALPPHLISQRVGSIWTWIYWQLCFPLLQRYLRSVKFKIWNKLIDAIAPVDGAFTFAGKLIEMVKRKIVERTDFLVDDWSRILKPTTKVVIHCGET